MLRRATCRTIRDLLPLHAGGDLPSDKAVLVDEHLHACLACFREFRDYAAMRGRLGVLAEEPLPPRALDGFTEDVMARIALGEEGPAAALPLASRWWSVRSQPVRLAAAAALFAALTAGLWQAGVFEPAVAPSRPVAEPPVAHGEPSFVEPAAVDVAASEPEVPRVVIFHGSGHRAEVLSQAGAGRAQEASAERPSEFDLPPGFEVLSTLPADPDHGLHPEPGRRLRPREP